MSKRYVVVLAVGLAVLLGLAGCSSGLPFGLGNHTADSAELEKQESVRVEVQGAVSQYTQADGTVSTDDVDAYIDAAYQAFKDSDDSSVAHVGRNDECAWAEFDDGSVMVSLPAVDGLMSMSVDADCSIQTYEPCNSMFPDRCREYLAMTDEAAEGLAGQSPKWRHDVDLRNTQVTLDALKQLGSDSSNEIILWRGHGGFSDDLGSFLLTGEQADTKRRGTDADYNAEFTSRRIVTCVDGNVAITSKFVDEYISGLDGALVHLGACSSGRESQLADAFLRAGAKTVSGYSRTVLVVYDGLMSRDFMKELGARGSNGYPTAKEALAQAQAANGASDTDQYGGEGARLVLFGDEDFRLDEAKAANSSSSSVPAGNPVYDAYYKKVQEYQGTYGEHGVRSDSDEYGEFDGVTGLGLVELIDFDHDGTEELVLGYGDESKMQSDSIHGNFSAYFLEVWGYDNGQVKRLYQGEPLHGDIDTVSFELDISDDASKSSVVREGNYVAGADSFRYLGLSGGSFNVIDEMSWSYDDSKYYVNGKSVSEDEYGAAMDVYSSSPYRVVYYTLGDLSFGVGEQVDYQSELFAHTDEVIAKLAASAGGTTSGGAAGGSTSGGATGGTASSGATGTTTPPTGGATGGSMSGNTGGFAPSGNASASNPDPGSSAPAPPSGSLVNDPSQTGSDGYVLPQSDTHRYTESELSGLDLWGLCVARNEIPARHGFIVDRDDLSAYFNGKSWYEGFLTRKEFQSKVGILNKTEEANVATILAMEKRMGSPYVPSHIDPFVADPDNVAPDGYVLPQSDTHKYTKKELSALDDWGLCIARNEIAARHGLIFDRSETANYFAGKTWYKGTLTRKEFRSIANILNEVEEANVATILEIEEQRNSPYRPEQ